MMTSETNGVHSDAVEPSEGVEIVLFGVRLKVDPLRKTVSLNNLAEYENAKTLVHSSNAAAAAAAAAAETSGNASADEAVHRLSSGGVREHRRGVPWTEEEHKLFILGLQKVGKGDWKGISKNFVKTRSPTQVASHAQKYFLRHTISNNIISRRKRRSSLFDITTESVELMAMEEASIQQSETTKTRGSQCPPILVPLLNPIGSIDQLKNHVLPRRIIPPEDLDLNLRLSLSLSFTSDQNQLQRHSAFSIPSGVR